MTLSEEKAKANDGVQNPTVPSISLPKGGGAIRGIGEKFAANPVTGTGSLEIPIPTSSGRSGFGPQLSLSYDSGAGNGPFGLGWQLSLPNITRKTDKGLPRYQDADESDVFILSGAEDLVPLLEEAGDQWQRHGEVRTVDDVQYRVQQYRPRIEGLFARIERWTDLQTSEIHWRSITRDNITTVYGNTEESRIADPNEPTRIFSWLICQSYDDKGNAIIYEYVEENSDDVDLAQVHERNRTALSRSANRYIKRIKYGNRTPNRDADWQATDPVQLSDWMFEVLFDYDEGHYETVSQPGDDPVIVSASLNTAGTWPARQDPTSTYRAGFEVRTYRLCHRVLMFHHFPDELSSDDYLVRSTDFTYEQAAFASFIISLSQSGYMRQDDASYLHKSLPPLEFEYSKATISDEITDIDPDCLENLPYGLDGAQYRWVDLDGEGISGILTEQADAWYYKPNIGNGRFAPIERISEKPSLANLNGGRQQLLDLAGDGQLDLAMLDGPTPGFYERTHDERWSSFRFFTSLPNIAWNDPNLRFVDLTGDGHADILITEDNAFNWHLSLAESGFSSRETVRQLLDEEQGPRLVFADGTQSIYLADFSGDGLTDLARIRNGEVCYWPNLGYGRFGAKVAMDNAPWFDAPDLISQRRIQLADIDGSGTTDIIYLGHDVIDIYRNQSGNGWEGAERLANFPNTNDLSAVTVIDLLGNGTACLVWSSPLPGDAGRQMRYVNLMGEQKPHLLVKTVNNLGAETRVHYAPSTKFYLQDKYAGNPWITKLPFPVHVVERVETYDHISRNRFVTRYAYHHGYFDGKEREFRGFGMVEQWDTEELAALTDDGARPEATNIDVASHVPPVHTKTWFHTGVYLGRDHISDFFAGFLDQPGSDEYYREPGLTDAQARALLLPDAVLLPGLTLEEEHEACRALKGSMLRQEVFALDGTPKAKFPYTVAEQNFSTRRLQPRDGNRHAVFFVHPREAINYHYERNPADPRIQHALTLQVDDFGNVLKEVAIGYGRRQPDASLPVQADRDKQTRTLVTYTENRVTNAIDQFAIHPHDYRTPLPSETQTYELTGFEPENNAARFSFDEWVRNDFALPATATKINYEEAADNVAKQKRLIEHVRSLYRKDDLTSILSLGQVEPLALPGESYQLAFTPGLLTQVFQRDGQGLLPNPVNVLGGQDADRGGYVLGQDLKAIGDFPNTDPDDHWWIPSGQSFFTTNPADSAATELAQARQHFFLPRRYRDPFGQNAIVDFDANGLLMVETRDALGNRVTVDVNDYRVLQPRLVSDPNRNQTEVSFDTLGMVVGTSVMGKPLPAPVEGDSLTGFVAALTQAQLDGFFDAAAPHTTAPALLQGATTRIVYDLDRFRRTRQAHPDDPTQWQPACAATLVRETHVNALLPPQGLKIQLSFSYSDGYGREVQKKIQAEPGPLVEGGLVVSPRWVGSGWTIFNNKGKPVRQYEPFFSKRQRQDGTFFSDHRFEFGVQVGVSSILFYDPAERVIATLHPNHSYEKVVFDPWQQTTWDVNDTVLGDPRTDTDIQGYTTGYFESLPASPPAPPWQTWHAQRQGNALEAPEQAAAVKATAHANTPTKVYSDTLGRPFLTVAHNKVVSPNHDLNGTEDTFHTRVKLDIEGNERAVRDAIQESRDPQGNMVVDEQGRLVMRYAYDMLGNRIHQFSMEGGARWMLNDVTGNPVRAWDSRGHAIRTEYDPLRRPLRTFVSGISPANPNDEFLTDRMVYGEQHPEAEPRNLRGGLYLQLDQAGAVTTESQDFKANPLRATRRIASEYKQAINWRVVDTALPAIATDLIDPIALEAALTPLLENDTYTSRTTYDALNRPVTLTTPHTPAMQPNVIRPGYNEANLLERMDASLRGATANGQPLWTPFVTNIDYDAKGQRRRIDYGNGVSTFYDYDPLTFRLVHLLSRRDPVAFPNDCPPPPPAGCQIQNLHYSYDPVGNITHIRDDAQQKIYFKNNRVEPSADYTYDALYRLIEATGREHLGQGGAPIPHLHSDAGRVGLQSGNIPGQFGPNEVAAMGAYIERYVYDAVGNFLAMQHRGSDPTHAGWTRSYHYAEPNQLELDKQSNRLTSTTVGNANPETYSSIGDDGYDAHGNMLRMPHLSLMRWHYRDQLQTTARQVVNNGGTQETTWYVYDAGGERVRKLTESANGQLKQERIYLSGFEIYRDYNVDGSVKLQRETLHMMDDSQRIALVETRTQGDDGSEKQLTRYQFGNHLGSASLELDHEAKIISYEEYTPYGSTSYQAGRSQAEVKRKQYRYTGMERDKKSGFSYHSARYYLPWLGRWLSVDPIGIKDGVNLYIYSSTNPVRFVDLDGHRSKPLVFWSHWLEKFRKTHPDLEGVNSIAGTPDEGVLTDTGIRVPIVKGNTLKPRRAYQREAAAFLAYQGWVHLAELVEAGHDAAAMKATLASIEERGGRGPLDNQLDLDRYANYSRRAVQTRNNFINSALLASMVHSIFSLLSTRALLWNQIAKGDAAVARATATQSNAQGVADVTRTITKATGKETFVHTTSRAHLPFTAESAAVKIEATQSINLSPGGGVGQWGEGVYAYEGTLESVGAASRIKVQFSVPPGTAIESITVPGSEAIIRLVPAEGATLQVVNPVTNLTEAQIAEGFDWLKRYRLFD
ncbi:MAG: toxin [Chloroflexi bacterium]|nr:toxin [Chloroflexota bacterium]